MTERLARSAGLIGVATLASRVLGLVRDKVLALFFGAGDVMDAYNVATRIPTLLRELFAEGAMSAAFVPTFTRYLTTGGKPAAWRLGSLVLNTLLAVTGALVVVGIVFATPLTRLYASEFSAVPGKLELTAQLTRITLPFLTLVALAAAFMGMLNALRRFFIPAFSPAMFNVVLIASAVGSAWLAPRLGFAAITGVAFGFVAGGVAQMAVQWPALRREGFRHRWTFDLRDPGLREVLILMGPGAVGQAAAQVNLLVNTWLATSEGTGAVSWLSNAFRLMYLPIGIFGVSVATAAIPDLARHAARGAYDDMRSTLSSGMRLMLMLSVPSFVGLVVLASPIVEATLQGGEFKPSDTTAVAQALWFYAPGLVGYSIVKIVSPCFYALRDARTPVIVSVVSVIANLVLNLLLVQALGYRGLALGTGIAANINAGLLLLILSRRIGGVDSARVLRALVKISIASCLMGVAAYYAEVGLHHLLPGQWLAPRLTRVAGAIGVGVGVLGLAAHLLRIQEFGAAMQRVVSRLRA
jgi:putative peptidoglycan lipid II flippase